MTRYDVFDEITQLCKITKTGKYKYNKIIQSGELAKTHYDYGLGYYDVCIYYMFIRDKHVCRIWFGTIDDGDFGSWTECETKEEAIKLVKKSKNIFSEMIICPNYRDLNLLFKDLGIFFHLE